MNTLISEKYNEIFKIKKKPHKMRCKFNEKGDVDLFP